MKYIRTKIGTLEDLDKIFFDANLSKEDYVKNVAVKQADTIEELIDEYVVYAKDYGYFNPTIIHRHWVFDNIEEAKEQIKLIGNGIKRIIYGAIWTKGVHDEPILKSVAKMKGVLPNDETDWELL